MLVADLIAVLQKLPQDARVITPDVIDMGDDGIEIYAYLAKPEVRFVSTFEIENMRWDFTPSLEQWAGASAVVLLKSEQCERADYAAPVIHSGGAMSFDPIERQ